MEIPKHKHDSDGPWFWGLKDGSTVNADKDFDIANEVIWGSATCSICGQLAMAEDKLGEVNRG